MQHDQDGAQLTLDDLLRRLQISQELRQYTDVAHICGLMSAIHERNNDGLMQASCLCEKASNLRLAGQQEVAKTAADAACQLMATLDPRDNALKVGTVYNDLGITYSELKEFTDATCCFKRALQLVPNARENNQLEAVITQNLGAVYNLQRNYQMSVKFHIDASEKFARQNNPDSQGQCLTNLAFAYSQLGDIESAETAFSRALLIAEDTLDTRAQWQVLEGLSAVMFNQGQYQRAADFLYKAKQRVGEENNTDAQRIQNKLLHVNHVKHVIYLAEAERIQGTASPTQSSPSTYDPNVATYLDPIMLQETRCCTTNISAT